MIAVNGLTKAYPFESRLLIALDHVSFRIAPGEYAAIVGPSGSGKSTLMHLLGCLDTPTSGSYRLHGQDVSAMPPRQLAHVRGMEIGFVFQGFQLIPRMTAMENVALPMGLCGVPLKEREARATALLERVGLADRMSHRPSQLSGGQQQRVAIARALSRDPSVLLADEPTGSLDPESTREVLSLMEELHGEGRTIVLITHDSAVARRACRRLEISGGRLVADNGG